MVFLAKQSSRDSAFHVAIKYVPKQTILEFQNVAKMQQVMVPCEMTTSHST